MTSESSIPGLTGLIRAFAERRRWQSFHNPKNLALALSGEVGELCAELQWLTPEQAADLTPDQRARLADEMADVAMYLLRLADEVDVDLDAAVRSKLACNEIRFPAPS